ncbi:MAG: AAA family ATPase [Kiritimatiellae bacterium]|nr:AAA family ATPase [Kiritimatiellia bacterium]
MLIQLTISNFKSVRDEQTIDFYAPFNRDERPENTFPLPESKIRVLRSVGFYGPNAAGKSTVFEALSTIGDMVSDDGFKPEKDLSWYNPYRFDSVSRSSPTKFTLEFALPVEGILPYRHFIYEVSFDKTSFLHEKLLAYPLTGRRITLFSRKPGDTYKSIKTHPKLLEDGKRVPFFGNQSYLSAAWKAADAPKLLRIVASYLCGEFRLSKYKKTPDLHLLGHGRIASELLPYADFGIKKVITQKRQIDPDHFFTMERNPFVENYEAAMAYLSKRDTFEEYSFNHNGDDDAKGLIKLKEESDGTQVFFRLMPNVLNILDNGFTMLRDEIDRSMHPFLVEFIIRLFNDPEVNVNNAQLLFSTHNLALLSESLLRKDQIWFAEKRNGASEYFSLQDFDDKNVTPTSPFASWYSEGRFGGIPQIDYNGFVNAIKRLRKEAENA